MKNTEFTQKAIQSLGGQTIYKVDPKTSDIILIKSDYSKEQIQQEANRIEEEWNHNKYQRDRATSYPEIREQLDLLYHDMTAGKGDKTGEWYKAVNKVKTDNPKPE